jgi:hypothetical protein
MAEKQMRTGLMKMTYSNKGRANRCTLRTMAVRLGAHQDAWLTLTSAHIRNKGGVWIDRSAILRGVLDGVRKGGINLDACRSEEAIRTRVAEAVRRGAAVLPS